MKTNAQPNPAFNGRGNEEARIEPVEEVTAVSALLMNW